jgi:hypothetical protein
MIEYTIKVQRILLSQGQVLVYLTPVSAEGLEPLRHVVHIQKERFEELAAMDANAVLEAIRADIVKASPSFQYQWEIQQAAIDAALPESVFSAEGREFPVVTEDEQTAIFAAQQAPAEESAAVVNESFNSVSTV